MAISLYSTKRADRARPDKVRGLSLVGSSPVRSGRARVVEFSCNEACRSSLSTLSNIDVASYGTLGHVPPLIYFFYTSYWSYKNNGNLTAVNYIQHFAYYSYYKYQLLLIYPRDKIVL